MNDINSGHFVPFYECDSCDLQRSTEELTAKLFIKLQSDGSLSQLSPDLRQKLVEYLRNVKKSEEKGSKTDDLTPKYPLEASNWLIAEHLDRNGYKSTLSVFLIECKRSDRTFFSITDILTFIGIDLLTIEATKIVAEYLDKSSKLLLWKILTSVDRNKTRTESVTRAIQTENEDETEIETKLRHLDAVYSKRKADLVLRKQPINENFSLFERFQTLSRIEDERRIRREKETNEEWIKEAENLRRKETDEYARVVEERFRSRLDGLIARERDTTEALDKQKSSIEEELYRQRQQILADLTALKQRQDDWNNKKTSQERDMRLETERFELLKREIETRESTIREREERYDERITEQKDRFAMDEKRHYEERIQSVVIREKQIEDERKHLLDLKQSLQTRSTKDDEAMTRIAKLRSQLDEARQEVAVLSARETEETVLLKEEVKRLRQSIEDEKMRHADGLREANERADRQRIEITELKLEVRYLNDERQREKRRYDDELRKAKEIAKSLADRLKEQYKHISGLNENIEKLQRSRGCVSKVTPTKTKRRFVNDDSFLNAEIDLDGTYFDTTLNATRLPPELELESNDYELTQDDDDLSFIEDARVRIRALEYEAETLEEKYRTLKRDVPFSTSKLTSFQLEQSYRQLDRSERRDRSGLVVDGVLTSTVRDPRLETVSFGQETVRLGVVQHFEKKESLESVSKPTFRQEEVSEIPIQTKVAAHESGFSERSVSQDEDSLSRAESAPKTKPESDAGSQNSKQINFGSTINLDSMWRREDDSNSLDGSSDSVRDVGPSIASVPMSSTPYSIVKTSKKFGLESDLKEGNEEVSREISGGISDAESRKDDFEW